MVSCRECACGWLGLAAMAEQFSQGEAAFGFVSHMSVSAGSSKEFRELRGAGGEINGKASNASSAAVWRGGEEAAALKGGLFWCHRGLF